MNYYYQMFCYEEKVDNDIIPLTNLQGFPLYDITEDIWYTDAVILNSSPVHALVLHTHVVHKPHARIFFHSGVIVDVKVIGEP